MEHLDLAIAERKLHKHHRLLTAAGTVLDDILQKSVEKADIGSTLPLHLWIEQKEVYLESSRRTAISLCESTILVCSLPHVVHSHVPTCTHDKSKYYLSKYFGSSGVLETTVCTCRRYEHERDNHMRCRNQA